jgi:hypothetical protein
MGLTPEMVLRIDGILAAGCFVGAIARRCVVRRASS